MQRPEECRQRAVHLQKLVLEESCVLRRVIALPETRTELPALISSLGHAALLSQTQPYG